MTTRTRIPTRPRTAEVAFLLLGAGVFAIGLSAVAAVCVACAHPATVALG